jgi:hypothetical protein
MFIPKASYASVATLVAVALAGCGQARVEFTKQNVVAPAAPTSDQNNSPATVSESDDAPQPELDTESLDAIASGNADNDLLARASELGYRTLALPSLRSSRGNAFRWKSWSLPTNENPALDAEELLGPGHQDKPEDVLNASAVSRAYRTSSALFNLSRASSQRCVYRNRLIEALPLQTAESTVLPPPFGNHRLYCVENATNVRSDLQLERTANWEGSGYWFRWAGSTGRKFVPKTGKHTLEFKLTQRIASHEAFSGAPALALSDGMDVLLASTLQRGTGQDCTLERVFYLRVLIDSGQPTEAKLYARTRHFAKDEYVDWKAGSAAQKLTGYEISKLSTPALRPAALAACAPQHKAWVDCLNGADRLICKNDLHDVLRTNFGALLGERVRGFASDRIFTLLRDQANDATGAGALALWYDLETPSSEGTRFNPLALEDFQEFTDVVTLQLDSAVNTKSN